MKLYSCRVRLNGELKNEVNKFDVTAAEIRLLQFIHGRSENGATPVIEIKQTGEIKRSDSQERKRLSDIYQGFHGHEGQKFIQTVLGVAGVPLPQMLEEAGEEIEEEEVAEEIVAATPEPAAPKSPDSVMERPGRRAPRTAPAEAEAAA